MTRLDNYECIKGIKRLSLKCYNRCLTKVMVNKTIICNIIFLTIVNNKITSNVNNKCKIIFLIIFSWALKKRYYVLLNLWNRIRNNFPNVVTKSLYIHLAEQRFLTSKNPPAKMCRGKCWSEIRDRPVKTGRWLATLCTNPLETFLRDTICSKRLSLTTRAAVSADIKILI